MINDQINPDIWVEGLIGWLETHLQEGWTPYYVNFMFNALKGTERGVIDQMHRAIHREFYSRFMLRFVRHPNRPKEQASMPRLQLYPDRRVYKGRRSLSREIAINMDGLHFNGPMLLPPISRFHANPIKYIEDNFGGGVGPIRRIHVQSVAPDGDYRRLAGYVAKTVVWNRASADDILYLPKSPTEMRPGALRLTAKERELKYLQGMMNFSSELAESVSSKPGR
jgi:hypothetical protein